MRKFRDIVIMAKCNLKCFYCGGFNFDIDVEKVIQNLEKVLSRFQPGDSCFRVECRGEITLYPQIIRYLEEKVRSGYHIEILTNGTTVSKASDKASGLKYVFSIDGHTARMNKSRGLSQAQIDRILDEIFLLDAEIQCVYFRQTEEQINDFIKYLKERNYKGRLHIFPCIISGQHAIPYLDYDKLEKAEFLAPKEYFDRWKFIYTNKKREFVCDYFANGYTYYITSDEVMMVKCDGSLQAESFIHPLGEERCYDTYPCNLCINHNEYNNCRDFMNA